MVAAVWEIAAAVDAAKIPAASGDAVWLSMPSATLRGEGARTDNVWLRECLERLTGVKLSGEQHGDPWGAVLLAEWRLTEGGAVARLLIPPAGIAALRAPANFARLEADAVHRLPGHARRLYAVLADKRRLRRAWWSFSLDELRALLGVDGRGSYARFNTFRQRVLDPALAAINDFGTVSVTMTPERIGRAVAAVRFDWRWRDPHEASEAVAQNERHSAARRRAQGASDAPPILPGEADGHGPDAASDPAQRAALAAALGLPVRDPETGEWRRPEPAAPAVASEARKGGRKDG